MLDVLGTFTIAITTALVLVAFTTTALREIGPRLVFAAVAGAWIALAITVTASGRLAFLTALLVTFAFPLVATAVLAFAVPSVRAALMRIPLPLVIALNAMRVLGILFIALVAAGRLGGPFPFSAGIGDLITGIFALSVARIAARNPNDVRVATWNAFGTLDLVVAVLLGVTSRNGSPIQLVHAGPGSAAIATLPWSMIPLVLVPAYLIGHAIVFAHLRRSSSTNEQAAPAFAAASASR